MLQQARRGTYACLSAVTRPFMLLMPLCSLPEPPCYTMPRARHARERGSARNAMLARHVSAGTRQRERNMLSSRQYGAGASHASASPADARVAEKEARRKRSRASSLSAAYRQAMSAPDGRDAAAARNIPQDASVLA